MSSTRRATVISNDEPDSSYGARRLAAAFEARFVTALVDPLLVFERPSSWLEERGVDVLVLSGSERSVLDELPWMLEEEDVLRSAVAAGVPTFAVCFGHQLLAKALGSKVVRGEKSAEQALHDAAAETHQIIDRDRAAKGLPPVDRLHPPVQ